MCQTSGQNMAGSNIGDDHNYYFFEDPAFIAGGEQHHEPV